MISKKQKKRNTFKRGLRDNSPLTAYHNKQISIGNYSQPINVFKGSSVGKTYKVDNIIKAKYKPTLPVNRICGIPRNVWGSQRLMK